MNFALNSNGVIKNFGPKKVAKAETPKPEKKPAKKSAKAKKEDSE